MANKSGFTRCVDSGSQLGYAVEVQVVEGCDGGEVLGSSVDETVAGPVPDAQQYEVWTVSTTDDERRRRLLEMVDISTSLDPDQVECLRDFLMEHHQTSVLNQESVVRQEWCRWRQILGESPLPAACMPHAFCREAGGCKAAEGDATVWSNSAFLQPLGKPSDHGTKEGRGS